ncbi:hypothetical protein GY45DRAFT_436201 [Cubamyces sp. BRFM 1775]|nr:hypothetical protein GY45DRAFT_436201 [Cubamyces sp. BRFM 1775]
MPSLDAISLSGVQGRSPPFHNCLLTSAVTTPHSPRPTSFCREKIIIGLDLMKLPHRPDWPVDCVRSRSASDPDHSPIIRYLKCRWVKRRTKFKRQMGSACTDCGKYHLCITSPREMHRAGPAPTQRPASNVPALATCARRIHATLERTLFAAQNVELRAYPGTCSAERAGLPTARACSLVSVLDEDQRGSTRHRTLCDVLLPSMTQSKTQRRTRPPSKV